MGFLKSISLLTKRELTPIQLNRISLIPEFKLLPAEYTILNKNIKIIITENEYLIEEPELSSEEKNIYHLIEDSLIEIIDLKENTTIEEYLEKAIRIIISELNLTLNEISLQKILYYSYRNIIGLRKIQPLIEDPLVTKIYFNNGITIEHKIFKVLKTKIILSTEELYFILRKISLKTNKDIIENSKLIFTEKNIEYSAIITKEIGDSKFSIKKITPKISLPTDLIKNRKCSPEILAFLWLLIEDHNNIFFLNDQTYLHTMSYLLPPHAKIFTNINSYIPNRYTTTNMGSQPKGDEDFGIIQNYKGQYIQSTLIASIEKPISDTITCEIKDEKIITITEAGHELFKYTNEKFLFNLEDSIFIKSKGNKTILIEEFKLRTKLLFYLSKADITEENFLKIIYAYYENPVKVLKKARII
ncbi:hypothetical protein J4223_02990 [Candidatus Woesearchaeota archaeon]|nr:hypothetical protein [Candidatus Woesearchaeota archaeon]